ncbi:MAG TPA: FAD-binding oxidoreductase, partial [Candidatus Thermoplasmatota archaeon]|nr:FAD-binding oxidoreductase [Candidatus Thermoplasmatota archaeon]
MAGKALQVAVAVAVLAYGPLFALSWVEAHQHADQVLLNDVARLNPTHVRKVVHGSEVEGLQAALRDAAERGLHVAIAGKRHSMGGHAYYPDAVVLDMTGFDRVLGVDGANRTVTVQSGATWRDVIEAVNPAGLAVGVMQAYNGFTIGGSLSVNVHESDPNFGPLVETVRSFRLLLANGTVVDVDRSDELFGLVIGGYGLFGVILDATLELTDDQLLDKEEAVINYADYGEVFEASRRDRAVGQIFARLSIAADETLLRDMVVTTYTVSDEALDADHRELQEPSLALKKLAFGLSRKYDWGKDLRWYLQRERSDLVDAQTISRNNLMNGDVGFLDYTSATDTDILQ